MILQPTLPIFGAGWWKLQWQRLMFTPGLYSVVFDSHFYDASGKPTDPNDHVQRTAARDSGYSRCL